MVWLLEPFHCDSYLLASFFYHCWGSCSMSIHLLVSWTGLPGVTGPSSVAGGLGIGDRTVGPESFYTTRWRAGRHRAQLILYPRWTRPPTILWLYNCCRWVGLPASASVMEWALGLPNNFLLGFSFSYPLSGESRLYLYFFFKCLLTVLDYRNLQHLDSRTRD